jgi:hypothetical protein
VHAPTVTVKGIAPSRSSWAMAVSWASWSAPQRLWTLVALLTAELPPRRSVLSLASFFEAPPREARDAPTAVSPRAEGPFPPRADVRPV